MRAAVARDQSEAAELIESHIKTESPASVYDAPAAAGTRYAERDRLEHRLSIEAEAALDRCTRVGLRCGRHHPPRAQTEAPAAAGTLAPRSAERPRSGLRGNGGADEVALAMLARLLDDLPIIMEVTSTRMQAVELVSLVRDGKFSPCFADLPPSSSSKTRYLVRRLRLARPELQIAVGRWGPPSLADESSLALLDSGADHVASLLVDSRNYLHGLLAAPRHSVTDAADTAA